MEPYDFKWTRFYEENTDFTNAFPRVEIELSDNELVICSTVIDMDNFSILTTRKLTTKERGVLLSGELYNATYKHSGDLKEHAYGPFTVGLIQLNNGNTLKYFIETGKASMVMVQGVKTRIQVEGMTNAQVDKLPGIWAARYK